MFKYLLLVLLFAGCAGPVGPQGSKGDTGASGAQGAQGVKGDAGQDAPQVSVVPLCPGFTPSYPSSFPEWALCVNDELFGVYSQNGGFLALLPPGTYTSNGINASCTVVIREHCQIAANQ